MKTYQPSTDVTEVINLVDDAGVALYATAVSYRVYDEGEVDVVASTPIAGFVEGSSDVSITVPGVSNNLAAGAVRGLRTIELAIVTAAGTFFKDVPYMLEAATPLVRGVNSYQNYSTAVLTAQEIVPGLSAWGNATQRQREQALSEAHARLGRLRYTIARTNEQSVLGGTTEVRALNEMELTEFDLLPEVFRKALYKAQVVEADAALGGDPIDDQRRAGLMSTTIGEVSQMYRPGTPLVLPVSQRALRYLTGYVKFGVGIGRA